MPPPGGVASREEVVDGSVQRFGRIVLLEVLPKTVTGKIQRAKVRERVADMHAVAGS